MSITIADCLKLPSLRNCRVIAGKKGLNHMVNSVSVLEVFGRETFGMEQLINNSELMLTSFASIKDDYQLQCQHIENMYNNGDAGLIIYYVGIYLDQIHPSLIETADRLGFPLLIMPENRMDCFYNEVLREIYEALFRNQSSGAGFIDNIASLVSRLPENRRNIFTLLHLISDHLKCTVLLSDISMNHVSISKWPASNDITAEEICALYEKYADKNQLFVETTRHGMPLNIFCVPFTAFEYRNFSIYVSDESCTLALDNVYHIIECLQVFSRLWEIDESNILENALIPAVIEGDNDKLYSISSRLGININSINTAVIIRPTWEGIDTRERLRLMRDMIKMLKECSCSLNKEIIADTYGIYIVCYIIYSYSVDSDAQYIHELIQSLDQVYDSYTISVFPNDLKVEDVQKTYQLYTEYIPDATKIFPFKKTLSYGDLLFGKECREMIQKKTEEYRICRNILMPLIEDADGDELLHTLAVYHLDADGEVKGTADRLYLHRNTVKYRLGKIRNISNFSSEDKLSAYLMYKAIACYRLNPSMPE